MRLFISKYFWPAVVAALALFPAAAVAQQAAPAAAPQSSSAAIKQYRNAVPFQNKGEYELAIDEWKAFLTKFPDDPLAPKAQQYLGVCNFQLKRFDEAQAAFETVVAKYRTFDLLDQTYLNLGMTYYSQAQAGKPELFAKAAETMNQLVTKFPTSAQVPQGMYYMAEAHYAAGDRAGAVEAWKNFLAKFATHKLRADTLYALGATQEELKQQADAGATYDLFLKEFPADPRALEVSVRKGETLFAGGKHAEAEKRFAAAAGTAGFALADHATMRWAAALYEQKKYAAAGDVYASLPAKFAKSSNVAAATLAAGNCYFLAGDQPKAREWFGKALAAGGETAAEAAHWLARSYLKDRQPAEALKTVEAALAGAEQSRYRVHLLLDQADALFDIPERRGDASARYADVAAKYPKDAQAPQAQYMAAFASLDQKSYDAAVAQAEAFLKAYGGDKLAPDVKSIAAESKLQLKQYAEAEKLYDDLLAKHADHADAGLWRVRRVLVLQLEKKHGDAIAALKSLTPQLKQPEALAEANYLLGNSHFELNQADEAVKAYQAALAASPKWKQADETLLNLSRAQRLQGKTADAIATVQRMIAEHAQSPALDRATYRLAEYAYDAQDYKTAAAQYQRVLDQWSSSELVPYALHGLGWAQLSQKDHAAAEKTLSAMLDRFDDHPSAARARYARAFARQRLKDYKGSLDDVAVFLRTNPGPTESAEALYVQGMSQAGLKLPADAIATFQSILKTHPDYAGADKVKYELGWAYKDSGQDAEAAQAFQTLAKDHPNSSYAAKAWFHVGEFAYHQKKDFKAAGENYYRAYQLQRKLGKSELGEKTTHKLAWSYYQLGSYAPALQTFQSQLAAYPQGGLAGEAAFMSGECLFKQAKYEPALAAYEKALTLKLAGATSGPLAMLHGAQAASQLQKWEQGLKLLDRFAKEFADSDYRYDAQYERGFILQSQDKLDEAAKLYEVVADETDTEAGAKARFMLGEIRFAEKNHKEAIRNFYKVAYGYGHPKSPERFHTWQAAATYEAARCYEILKSVDQAKTLYAELVTQYPASDKVPLAKARLAELEKQ